MEKIEILLKSFEKAGLYQGNILFEGKEYILRDGQFTVNVKPDVTALEDEKLEKIREEQVPSEIAHRIKPLIKIAAVVLVIAVTSIIFIINFGKESKSVLINKTRQKEIISEKGKKLVPEGKKKEFLESETELRFSTIDSTKKIAEKNDLNRQSEEKEKKFNIPDIERKEPVKMNQEAEIKNSEKVKEPRKTVMMTMKEVKEPEKAGKKMDEQISESEKFATKGIEKTKEPERFVLKIIQTPKIQFMKLPAGFRNEYLRKLKTIKIPGLGKGITIKGQISITMDVGDIGNISINNYDTKYLEVIPEYKESLLIRRIFTELKSIFLSPPLNSVGESVAVEDWRLIYRFGTFRGDLILNRVY